MPDPDPRDAQKFYLHVTPFRLGAFPVRRGEADGWALEHAAKVLAHGLVLGIFPEGTRTRGVGLKPGKTGAARLAIQANAPIVPVAIYGTHQLFKPWYRRSPVSITLGEPIWPAPDDDPAALTERLMRAIARMLPPEFRGMYAEQPLEDRRKPSRRDAKHLCLSLCYNSPHA